MKQEIRERIEKIRKGLVPEGYKKTKVGIIPEEWEVKTLGKIVMKFVNGGTPSRRFENYWNGNIPWITGADILNQEVSVIRRYITSDAVKNSSTNVIEKGNLLLVSRTGVGKVAIAPFDIAISQDFTGIYVKSEELLTEYLYRYFNLNQYTLQSQNQGTSIQGITRNTLSAIQIPLPTRAEQQKIEEILITWDKAIKLKEKLIEEKKEFKRGLMNNIISAKMKDDSGWKFAKFKEIFKIIKRPIDKHSEEEYKRLTVKRRLGGVELRDIKKGKEILVDSQHIVKEGDFIISNRQVFHGALGLIQKKHENSIISNEYSILRCNEGFDTEFLFYCMHSPQLKKTIIKRTQGVHEEKFLFLFNEWYKTLGLHIPSIDEQKSIVSVLNNLIENIRILTREVALLKEQKRGLKQLLLTGIVRVEVD